MKKIKDYLVDNTWTWVGTGLVLITLSGPTFLKAVTLTAFGVTVHAAMTLRSKD
jgi:hypothetical protein